ncbi:MAG TPA: ABC transporter ATP-binding protein [Pseudomonadales bacterium]|nr:ABC transporter ATP-binding protein [Pseudomonadales bacterium]
MIELRALSRTFTLGDSEVRALRDVNLRIGRGEYVSVMGPSGSGKSTLLNILGLLDRPDGGEYLLNGTPTAALGEEARARLRREHVGFVFQSYHLVTRLTARENIELPLMLAGRAPRERLRAVDAVLERLGIGERAGHLPNQLSGGERQRVAIGRSIVMKPDLLLADEPTGNLDSRAGAEVTALLEELNRDGITLLVVTHDATLGRRAARHLSMLDGAISGDAPAGNPGSAARAQSPDAPR